MVETILVTGGAGFIGSHTVDLLIDKNYSVVVVDTADANLNPKARYYPADITDKEKISEIFDIEKPDYVIHLAAHISVVNSVKNPDYDYNVNVNGTKNIIEQCKKHSIKKIVFSSSGAVYGNPEIIPSSEDIELNPLSPYGKNKLRAEELIKESGIPCIIYRYSNVYGPRQKGGVITIFINMLKNNEQPIIYGDKQTRDFVFVKDVAKANVLALETDKTGIFNISAKTEISVIDLFELIKNTMNSDIKPIFKPANAGEALRSSLDNSKAVSELGWKPETSLKEGIKEMLK